MTQPATVYAGHVDTSGYGIAARRAHAALGTIGADSVWMGLRPGYWNGAYAGVPAGPLNDQVAPGRTLVAHLPPDHIDCVRSLLDPFRTVVHTVWETTVLPPEWDGRLTPARVDGIVVPTEWNAGLVRAATDVGVYVVPHACASPANTSSLAIEVGASTFVFACVSTWTERKNLEGTVRAYLRAFRRNDDVLLVIKTAALDEISGSPQPAWQRLVSVTKEFRDPAPILLVVDRWSDDQIAALVARADCYVSLAKSEGWGLGIFDAVCAGTPAITTGWGGPLEYLGADYPGLIPVHLEPAVMFGRNYGEWANPSEDAAVDMLRSVVADGGTRLSTATAHVATRLHVECAPQRVGRLLQGVVDTLA